MTDNENYPLDTDILIGNLLHQTEAVVPLNEARREQAKTRFLTWLRNASEGAEPTSVPSTDDNGSADAVEDPQRPPQSPSVMQRAMPEGPATRSQRHSDRPLNEVKFLTVAEVASVMRVSKMTVYRLVRSGHLPSIRAGHSFRIPEQAVREYLGEVSTRIDTEHH